MKIDVSVSKNRYTTELLIELQKTMPHYSAQRSAIRETLRKRNKQQKTQKRKFFSERARRREKGTQMLTTHITFTKRIFSNKQTSITT